MKPLVIVGILLIVLGVFALAYEGITYTRTERVIDLASVTEARTLDEMRAAGAALV